MNILIPDKWLREYLSTKATPKQIQEYLSLCGLTVERIVDKNGDKVYDIEVTTNRVDAVSVYGVAREAAAILPEFGLKTQLKSLKPVEQTGASKLDFTIENDKKLCHRILAVKLKNVKIGPSPEWLADRLLQVDQRPINNAIDITNYVMWEVGHPIHAFDYDRLTEKKIVVREAKKGESLITLDNKKHVMIGGEVVFDDGTGRIVDLPGIMGTQNTVVTEKTENVLLWIESVDAKKIRFASMSHAIRSQAAVLNEKNVDPVLGLTAIGRGVELYTQITGAKVDSQLVDIFPDKKVIKSIKLNHDQLTTYVGVEIAPSKVVRILTSLGCKVETLKKGERFYEVTPPSFRSNDITIYQDLIEEVARIYGYHNLPSMVMDTVIPDTPPKEDFNFEYQIKTWLSNWGLSEVYTYSMVSGKLAKQSSYPLDNHLKLKNPLSDDWVYMRRSLIPSLVQVIDENQKDKLRIFEMQNVYIPAGIGSSLPEEELQLVVVSNVSYGDVKGVLDLMIKKLYLENLVVEPAKIEDEPLVEEASGRIVVKGTKLGVIGKVKGKQAYALKLYMDKLQKMSNSHPKYIPAVITPPIVEDLTFTLKAKTYVGQVMEEISLVSKLIVEVKLKDKYKLKTKEGENYTFTVTYRDPRRPLTDKELAPIRKKIVTALNNSFSASLVGKL
jgi:phenylalanyl-tRNA synthetase beta chain